MCWISSFDSTEILFCLSFIISGLFTKAGYWEYIIALFLTWALPSTVAVNLHQVPTCKLEGGSPFGLAILHLGNGWQCHDRMDTSDVVWQGAGQTSSGGEMSRTSASHSGRSGNPKIASSNTDLAVFEHWSSQTIVNQHCQARLAQCHNNATEWASRSWCQWPGFTMRQHYEVGMSVHCHKLVPVPPLCLSNNCEVVHTSSDH